MSSHMTASSVITLTGDLVTEHPVGTKIAYSIFYLIHIVSSFAICFVFCGDFYQNLIEFCSIAGVIVASWIATSIANLVLYQTIRPRGRYMGPENAPGSQVTAGICLRLIFTLLPFSPVLRYIEAWRANRLLDGLEAQFSRRPNGSLAPGEEKTLRTVQRTRRECRRRDKAAGLLSLFNACISGGTMLVLLLYFFAHRLSYGLPPYSTVETACLLVCVVGSGLWLATAMLHFYPAQRNSTVTAEHSTSPEGRLCGLLLLFLWHFLMVAARAAALSLFAVIFGAVVFAVVAGHVLFCVLLLRLTRCLDADASRRCSVSSVLRDLFHGVVGIFDFVNADQGRTRLRYLLFYALMLAENGAFVGVWYARKRPDEGLSRLPVFLAVVIADVIGLVVMQLYYVLFFPESDNPGLLSLCSDAEPVEKGGEFVDVRLDPQVAYKLQSSKLWVERQNFHDASSVHTDVIPPSDDASAAHVASVVSFQLSGSRDPRIPRSSRPPSSLDSESLAACRPPSVIRDARLRSPPGPHGFPEHPRAAPMSTTSVSPSMEPSMGSRDPRVPSRGPRGPPVVLPPVSGPRAPPVDSRGPRAPSVDSRGPRAPSVDSRGPRAPSVEPLPGRGPRGPPVDHRVAYRDRRTPGNGPLMAPAARNSPTTAPPQQAAKVPRPVGSDEDEDDDSFSYASSSSTSIGISRS